MQPCTLVFVSLIAVAKSSSTAGESAWGYDETSTSAFGPTRWSEVAPQCAGFAQSPIDIEEYPLKSSNHWKTNLQISFAKQGGLVTGTLINNGHAPTLQVEKGGTGCVTLTGGPVGNSDYVLEQFHFHFGCASNIGSEHTLHGKSYPVEVHFVFYSTKYKNFADAMDKPDGLAVVGSFFELCLRANTILEKLKSKLEMIIEEGANASVGERDGIYLKHLVPALNRGSPYYTYQGSLTTPPCYQSVRWILLQVPAPLNPAQLIAFNRLQARHGYAHGRMCNNFRPTQPRNGREVLLIY